jgi:virginiamycin B lyase
MYQAGAVRALPCMPRILAVAFVLLALSAAPAGATTVELLGPFGAGNSAMYGPVAAAPDGSVWIGANHSVQHISASGAALGPLLTDASLTSGPADMVVAPDGNLWFTAPGQIWRVTPAGVATFTPVSAGADPFGIAVGPDGNIWFAEQNANKIGRIFPDGSGLIEFPLPAAAAGPRLITAGADGRLWFSCSGGLGRISTAGVPAGVVNVGGAPFTVTKGRDGNVWAVLGNHVVRVTPAGAHKDFPLGPLASPNGIAAGSDGNIWVTLSNANGLARIKPDGTVDSFSGGGPFANPRDISAGPANHIWFGTEVPRMGRVTLDKATAATTGAVNVAPTGASLRGTVSPFATPSEVWFDWGATPSYGARTPTQSLTSQDANQSVAAALGGLAPQTTYHYRVVVRTALGTVAGLDRAFTTPAAPPPPPVDADRDGFPSSVDCNDGDPGVNPGAADIPGDGRDQNCDGADTPFPVVGASAALTSQALGNGRTKLLVLTLGDLAGGETVKIGCRGKGCSRRLSQNFKVKRAARALPRTRGIAGAKLRTGAQLQVAISRPGYVSVIYGWTMQRGVNTPPKRTKRCRPPGATRAQKC